LNKPTRFYSKKQEQAVAKVVNGRRTANSGATPFYKGDVVTNDWCIECKTATEAKASMSIKREWFSKLKEEAFGTGKHYSAVAFNYGPDTDNHYIIDEKTFKRVVELFEKEDHEDAGWTKPW